MIEFVGVLIVLYLIFYSLFIIFNMVRSVKKLVFRNKRIKIK